MLLHLNNGYKIFYDHWLEGDRDVLIITGGPGLSYEYAEIFKEFMYDCNVRITVYDQLGCYHSDKPDKDFNNDINYYVEEVEELRVKLDLKDLVIVGHSWGGCVVQEYLSKYSDRLTGAVIINSFYASEVYMQNEALRLQELPQNVQNKIKVFLDNEDFGAEFQELLYTEWHRRHLCRLDEWPEPLLRSLGKASSDLSLKFLGPNIFNFSGLLKNWDIRENMRKVKIPVFVVGGKYDITTEEELNYYKENYPNCEVLMCEHSSHMPMYEEPVVFFQGINKFIKNL